MAKESSEQKPKSRSEEGSGGSGVGRMMVINVLLPIIAYTYVSSQGYSPVTAFSAAAVFPLASSVHSVMKTQSVDGIALFVLITLVVNILIAYVSKSTRMVFVEGSVVTVLLGVVCFGSILVNRPLLFYFSRSFNAGDDPAELRRWNERFDLPEFRDAMNKVTAVWGIVLVIAGVLHLGLVLSSSVQSGFLITTVYPVVYTAGLIAWTKQYIKGKHLFTENPSNLK